MGLRQRRKEHISYGRPLVRDTSDIKAAAKVSADISRIEGRQLSDIGGTLKEGVSIYKTYERDKKFDQVTKSKKPLKYDQIDNIIKSEIESLPASLRMKSGAERKLTNSIGNANLDDVNRRYGTNYTKQDIANYLRYANNNKVFKTSSQVARGIVTQMSKTPGGAEYDYENRTLAVQSLNKRFKQETGRDLSEVLPKEEYESLEKSSFYKASENYLKNNVISGELSGRNAYAAIFNMKEKGEINESEAAQLRAMVANSQVTRANLIDKNNQAADRWTNTQANITELSKKNFLARKRIKTRQALTLSGQKVLSKTLGERELNTAKRLVMGGASPNDVMRQFMTRQENTPEILPSDKVKAQRDFDKFLGTEIDDSLFYSGGKALPFNLGRDPDRPSSLVGIDTSRALYHSFMKYDGRFKSATKPEREQIFRDAWKSMGKRLPPGTQALTKKVDKLGATLENAGISYQEYTDAIAKRDMKELEKLDKKIQDHIFNERKKRLGATDIPEGEKKGNARGILDTIKGYFTDGN